MFVLSLDMLWLDTWHLHVITWHLTCYHLTPTMLPLDSWLSHYENVII